MSVKATLRNRLAAGEIERTVDALQSIAERYGDQYFQRDVTHQAGRFHGLKRERQQGTVSDEFYNLQLNNIRQALQDLIDKVPPNAQLPGQTTQPETPESRPEQPTPPTNSDTITPTTSPHIPWIVGLVLLIGATGLAVAVPCPSQNLLLSSRILLALGAAGIATVLPGLFNIDLQGIKAGSAVGVFALVYLVNPAKMMENNNCAPQFTSVTVFVHGKNGRQDMILRQQGFVLMDVGNERKRASINENGQAFFQNLRIGDTVQLNVDFSEPYKATQPNKKYVIEDESSIYLETALQGLDKVFGTVLDGDDPLPGVLVSIGALRDTTDETGYYEIQIPENLQQKQQEVKFTKPGYKMTTKTAYPQTNAPLNIVLSK